jgi:hypothetical protein
MKPAWTRRQRTAAALVALLVCALVAWLDSTASGFALAPHGPARTASYFVYIWQGITALAGILAAGAEIAVTYLATAVSWLASRVATILTGTGAIFSKVWDSVKIVWSDVLKPTLLWIDDKLKAAYTWMKSTFKPVFDFLNDIRRRLNDFYNTFIKPITDTIDFIRAINRALLAFHITFLQDLDSLLAELEARIREPFLWVNAQLNKILNVLDLIVTFDGLLQQVTLLHSMSRYAPAWINHFWKRQFDPTLQRGTPYDRDRDYPTHEVVEDVNALSELANPDRGERGAVIGELGLMFLQAAQTQPGHVE